MAKTNLKRVSRYRRKKHIRKKVHGTAERPRLSVFRSAKHIYVQLVDDESNRTIASASSLAAKKAGGNREGAREVGRLIAEAAKQHEITHAVFDRNGYLYHGRVAALADAAREAGLQF